MRYHLTARPFRPVAVPREAYLDVIETIARFTVRHQDGRGAVVDPYLHREHHYATPYFAFAGAVLMSAGRAADLFEHVARAMDHATACVAGGTRAIPDQYGEFFLAPLTGALELLKDRTPAERWAAWQHRLRTPLGSILEGEQFHLDNRRTYAMWGEWKRARAALVDASLAREWVERNWIQSQRERLLHDQFNLYQDHGGDPESHAYDVVGRANLLALAADGFHGKYAPEIQQAVEAGTNASLLMQDPAGQCPPNGRMDNHVLSDVLCQLAFEFMAERSAERRQEREAGQFRRAATLAFGSIARWRRGEGAWDGSYYVTRNRFDPALRVGYEPGGTYSGANGSLMMRLAQAWLARRTEIAEQPTPAEIGGYAFAADPRFASVFANAGGMQMMANLRGDNPPASGAGWTALGVVRLARTGWDSRLGPSDGTRDRTSGRGVSFGPTWLQGGRWVRLADVPDRYHGRLEVLFVHPLLVRCAIAYAPVAGKTGPAFRHEFTITPDGILANLQADRAGQFAVTWPLLEDDGRPLETAITRYIASVRYPGSEEEQNFIAMASSPFLSAEEEPVRGSCGWLRPVRARANLTFVYPRSPGDPAAELVRTSFKQTQQGFSTVLGRVVGNLYVGRTVAGGEGKSLDLDGDGHPEVTFSAVCGFVLQLADGVVTAIEADRAVNATVQGRRLQLSPWEPVNIGGGS